MMHLEVGRPFKGRALDRLRAFLRINGLDYDEGIQFTALLMEDDQIAATASLDGGVIKCVAVAPEHQGEGLTAPLMTAVRQEAFNCGQDHLMLFTKPGNLMMFREFGFYPVIRTEDCLLMENRRAGLDNFLSALKKPTDNRRPVGCVVANCNPFTNGHRYLIETAATQCEWLHLFVLSEDKSCFSAEARMEMVKRGCADLKNVLIHSTGPYLVSSATFPTYFIKDKSRAGAIYCQLDVRLFAEKIVPPLNITCRFVGTEPYSEITNAYNMQMKAMLPEYGVELVEIPRKTQDGDAISASRVRALLKGGDLNAVKALVPETTFEYLAQMDAFKEV